MNTLDPMYFGVNIVSFKVVSSVEETTDLSTGEGKIAGTQTAKAVARGAGEERRTRWRKRRQILRDSQQGGEGVSWKAKVVNPGGGQEPTFPP